MSRISLKKNTGNSQARGDYFSRAKSFIQDLLKTL